MELDPLPWWIVVPAVLAPIVAVALLVWDTIRRRSG
jgi:hypothetical protein